MACETARRKFVEVHKATTSPAALEIIQRIAAVYGIEEAIRGRTAEHRQSVRASASAPLMAALKQRLVELLDQVSAKSPLAKAIRYTLRHWDGLTVFLADGRVEGDELRSVLGHLAPEPGHPVDGGVACDRHCVVAPARRPSAGPECSPAHPSSGPSRRRA